MFETDVGVACMLAHHLQFMMPPECISWKFQCYVDLLLIGPYLARSLSSSPSYVAQFTILMFSKCCRDDLPCYPITSFAQWNVLLPRLLILSTDKIEFDERMWGVRVRYKSALPELFGVCSGKTSDTVPTFPWLLRCRLLVAYSAVRVRGHR